MKNKTSKKTSDKKISRKTIFGLIAVVVVFAVVSVAMLPLIHLLSSEHGQQVIRVSASSLPCCLCCCKCYRWSLP